LLAFSPALAVGADEGIKGMAKGVSAAAWQLAGRRIAHGIVVAAALAIVAPGELEAQTSGSPPIRIPPARLPPLAEAPPSAPALPAKLQPAPQGLLPTHVQILRDSQGSGVTMYGVLGGEAASAAGVILAIFAYSEAFDPTPAVQLLVADERDQRAQAMFTARIRGVPVTGIAVATLGDKSGDVTVFYDIADTFGASFRRMQRTLKENAGLDTVMLSSLHLNDGSEIGLPPGWHVTNQGANAVDLRGPQGEYISLGAVIPVYSGGTGNGGLSPDPPCCDPRTTFETLFPKIASAARRRGLPAMELAEVIEANSGTPGNTGQSASLLSHLRVDDADYSYLTIANAVAGVVDPWTFTLSGVMAPRTLFASELPMLLQIWDSYRPIASFGVEAPKAVLGLSAVEAMLGASITRRKTADYNANEGWDGLIMCIEHIANPKKIPNPGCAQAQVDTALAEQLLDKVSSDAGSTWRVVPQAQWK
jgi:hypothetical protein